MPDTTTITEADLRGAMRDPRYWQPGHPERRAFSDWVTAGWQALVQDGEGSGATRQVKVRAYTRTRLGHEEKVGAYTQMRHATEDKRRSGTLRARPAPAPARPPAPTAQPAPAQAPAPVPPTFVAFVGGAGDATMNIVRGYYDRVRDALGARRSGYFAHDEGERLRRAIEAQPAGTRIVIVGHSWGGHTAAQLVAALGAQGRLVDTLVTVDPVGVEQSEGFMGRVRGGSREWINIRAVGGAWYERSNMIAAMGNRYGSLPERFATQHIEAPVSHGDFTRMMEHRGRGGRSAWDRVLGR